MRSTQKIHDIVDRMPEEDRREMMKELNDLRLTIAEEVVGAMRNAHKMVKLMYGYNGGYHSQGN